MTNVRQIRYFLCKIRALNVHYQTSRIICSGSNEKSDKNEDNALKLSKEMLESEELVEPTTCCMSGCANCVWIQYAEKLSKLLQGTDKDVSKIVLEKIQDPNMRAFLSLELRCRNLKD